jgi:hydrogenase maturation protein HypF
MKPPPDFPISSIARGGFPKQSSVSMPRDSATTARRLRVLVRGAVQGVGFRPFVFRLASELGLVGWVNNSSQGVFVEVEGTHSATQEFLRRLEIEKPPRSFIQSLEASWLDPAGYQDFQIRQSDDQGDKLTLILPDIASCPDCVAEIFDPQNRRFLYPFTNCTNCGPRFSIIEALPYDRSHTSMRRFIMCPECQAEYDNPHDRRFHAQPNGCHHCGPHLELWDPQGHSIAGAQPEIPEIRSGMARQPQAVDDCALAAAAQAIRSGQIVAVKGLGGFHLMARADADAPLEKLRRRKRRGEKPFAVMLPSLAAAWRYCQVSPTEERLLRSPEAPIVLLRRLSGAQDLGLSPLIAPANPNVGVLLPYTPLHHLLLSRLEFPVVATSGNLSDEPICIEEHEALERLHGIADLFLVHNRAIVRHVDDSIVRIMAGRELVLRRARGFAPLPITLPGVDRVAQGRGALSNENSPLDLFKARTGLAVGAHLKNAVALAIGPQVFISQHIGDLETAQALEAFRRVSHDLQRLYDSPAAWIASDLHPDYSSTRFADESGLPCVKVQHHVAHVLSCMAENDLQPPVLGVAWDGTGFGTDRSIWGGEFFRITETGSERIAHFKNFPLPGGEIAIRQPRRSALGLLYAALGTAGFDETDLAPVRALSRTEAKALKLMLARGLNSPLTSSVGRLFDAVASLVDLRQSVHFEGQAAMDLEFILPDAVVNDAYKFSHQPIAPATPIDWRPCLEEILVDHRAGVPKAIISARFHNGLVDAILAVARAAGLERVVLSGGCFQNRYLTERAVEKLTEAGFRAYWHQRVPPNDAGICLGQVVAARWWNV